MTDSPWAWVPDLPHFEPTVETTVFHFSFHSDESYQAVIELQAKIHEQVKLRILPNSTESILISAIDKENDKITIDSAIPKEYFRFYDENDEIFVEYNWENLKKIYK